jgi:undecaprenyl-diphosphatase
LRWDRAVCIRLNQGLRYALLVRALQGISWDEAVLPVLPALAVVLIPFTMLTAASRIVLGLHYPSDVLAGAAIGAAVALASFRI